MKNNAVVIMGQESVFLHVGLVLQSVINAKGLMYPSNIYLHYTIHNFLSNYHNKSRDNRENIENRENIGNRKVGERE